MTPTLDVRWLGRVPYREALALQEAIFARGSGEHLLLLEHPHVFTHGPSADLSVNLLCDPAAVGAELVAVKRGGDVTYHGPGQLVGYPLLNLPPKHGTEGPADSAAHVARVEQLVIDVLADLIRGCGSSPTATAPARSAPSVFASAGDARCTASHSTSTPISRTCATTSCPAASPNIP